jgi:putative ABC transport system permease protein
VASSVVEEEVRATRWESHLEYLFYDFRYACRVLRKDIRFSLTAILTLALGIAATTAMFSVVYNLWFDPFPYNDADRLMVINIHDVKEGANTDRDRQSFSIPEFLEYRGQNQVFEDIVGSYNRLASFSDDRGTQRFGVAYLTANTFEFYSVPPLLGRGITPDDGNADAPPVFVMNYKVWKDDFNSDPAIVGKIFLVDGKQRTLVGVMPPRFQAYGGRLWLPLSLHPNIDGTAESALPGLWVVGRRKQKIPASAVNLNIEIIAKRLSKLHPAAYPERFTVRVQSLADALLSGFRVMLYALLSAVAMLLFISCANVANLLLVKATTREREVAVCRYQLSTRSSRSV